MSNVTPCPTAGGRVIHSVKDVVTCPTTDQFGDDIKHDVAGRSYFDVTEGKMYRILEVPEFGQHNLKLSSNSDNFAIFAFTFGIYDGGF